MIEMMSAAARADALPPLKILICGLPGVGKTSLLNQLGVHTLCVDSDIGLLSVPNWHGSSIRINTWPDAMRMATLLANPAAHSDITNKLQLLQFDNIFVDSLATLSKKCSIFCQENPIAGMNFSKQIVNEFFKFLALLNQVQDFNVIMTCPLLKVSRETDVSIEPDLDGYRSFQDAFCLVDCAFTIVVRNDGSRAFSFENNLPYKDRTAKFGKNNISYFGEFVKSFPLSAKKGM